MSGEIGGGQGRANRRERLFTRDFVLLCLSSFAIFTSFYFLLPTLPLYVKDLGGQDAEIGLIIGAFTVTAVVTRLLGGRAVDVWGRKWPLAIGAFLYLVGVLLYSTTTTVPSILLLRLFHGLGFGLATTAAGTLVADLAPLRRRAEAMGYYGNFNNVAMALAPAAGLWMIAAAGLPLGGFPLLFAAAGAVATLGLVFTLLVRETHRDLGHGSAVPTRSGLAAFFNADAVPVAIAMAFFALTYGAIVTFLSIYLSTENTQNVAIFFLVYSGVVVVSRPFAGRISDRVSRRAVVIPAMALSAVGVGILAISPTLPVAIASAIVYGVGFGALFPSMLALAVDAVRPQERGAAMGTFMGSFDVGIALGSIALGFVAQGFGYAAVFLIAAAVGGLGLCYFLVYPRFFRQRPATPALAPSAPNPPGG